MPRANKQIRARQVRLVDQDGNQVGVISFQEALDAASKVNLDLVEVSPNADPPVCRLMDLGKYMYNKSKKERQARKAQVKTKVKEIRLRPKTAGHDRDFMVRDARKWLERGDKVKVRIRFRGRELSHPEVAKKQLDEIADLLSDVGAVEQRPAFEGRSMLMILGPAKSKA
jgi:translation initiation factor IF-3